MENITKSSDNSANLTDCSDSAPTSSNDARTTPIPQQAVASPSPPKKSARLAEKRKLREEAGPVSANQDEEFYFTPFKSCRLSSPLTIAGENQINNTRSEDVQQSTNLEEIDANEKAEDLDTSYAADDAQHQEAMSSKLGTISFGDDSSEEDKWFDSLDVGKLEDNVVEIDDISTSGERLLTERQKSFIFKHDTGFSIDRIMEDDASELQFPKELAQTLPSRCTNGKTRKEKSERRRVLAQQKKEYDKKRTVDRLLKKSNHVTKQSKGSSPEKSKDPGPMITYLMRVDGNSISFPEGIDISVFGDVPLSKKSTEVSSPRTRDPVMCGVQGCLKPKKYSCSKTKIPLCSLECYKKNLLLISS